MRSKLGVLRQYPPRPLPNKAIHNPLILPAHAPRISIVTPSFNQSEFIERTIDSVLGQGYPNLEYIVQDGASRDGTIDILKRFEKRLTYWESLQDQGQSDALNRGFVRSDGEIMAYLNSDDLLMSGSLAVVADYFLRHPEVDVIYSHRIIIDENDFEIGRWFLPRHDSRVLCYADYIPQETLFWRRSIWEKVGGRIDPSFNFAMDWDLLLRFQAEAACIKRLPIFLGAFRVHSASKTYSSLNDLGMQEMQLLRQRSLGYIPDPLETRSRLAAYKIQSWALQIIYEKPWLALLNPLLE